MLFATRRTALIALAFLLVAPPVLDAQGVLGRIRRAVEDTRRDIDGLANDLAITRQNLEDMLEIPCENADLACPSTVMAAPTFNAAVYHTLAVVAVDETYTFRGEGAITAFEDIAVSQVLERGYTTAGIQNLEALRAVLESGDGSADPDQLEEISEFVAGVPGVMVVTLTSSTMRQCRPSNPARGARYWQPEVRVNARLVSTDVGEVVWLAQQTSTTCHEGTRDEAVLSVLESATTSVMNGLPSLLEN